VSPHILLVEIGLLESIECQTRLEEGTEEFMQGAMEVELPAPMSRLVPLTGTGGRDEMMEWNSV
jgi:hypothetical protein